MVNKSPKSICLFLIVFQVFLGIAQSTDLVRVEYLRIPNNNVGIETSRYKFSLNVPIKLDEDSYVVLGGEYNQFDVDFLEDFPFPKTELEKLQIIDLNLGYITKWNETWSFIGIITPRLASNFTDGILSDDFFINATATLLKERKDVDKPFRIVVGLSFNSTTGVPIPLPFLSYYKRFHPNWSYTLGIPKMNFKYHPDKKNTLQMALLLDGYFINVQDDIVLPDNTLGSRISLSAIIGVLGYQYNINKLMSLYVLTGRSFIQEGILRNDQRDRTFLLNNEPNFYLRTGFKIGIF